MENHGVLLRFRSAGTLGHFVNSISQLHRASSGIAELTVFNCDLRDCLDGIFRLFEGYYITVYI